MRQETPHDALRAAGAPTGEVKVRKDSTTEPGKATSERCAKSIYDSMQMLSRPCGRPVKIRRNGKPWCAIHDPEVVTKRRAAKEARWDSQHAAEVKRWALATAAPELLAFVKRSYESTACVCKLNKVCGTDVNCTHCEAKALIAKAGA